MLTAVSDAGLATLITAVATIAVATVGAIAALGARASGRRTETTAASIDDAVNHRHITNSPRLFDLVRTNAEHVETLIAELEALAVLMQTHIAENERAHKALGKELSEQTKRLTDHATWEETSKYPEIEAAIWRAMR